MTGRRCWRKFRLGRLASSPGCQPLPCSKTLTPRANWVPPLFPASHGSPAPRVGGGGVNSRMWCWRAGFSNLKCPVPNSDTVGNFLRPSPRPPASAQCPPYPECPSPVTTATILVSQATPLRFWWLICLLWLRVQERKREEVKQVCGSRPRP